MIKKEKSTLTYNNIILFKYLVPLWLGGQDNKGLVNLNQMGGKTKWKDKK